LSERKNKEREEDKKLAETIPGSSSDNAYQNSYSPPWAAPFPS